MENDFLIIVGVPHKEAAVKRDDRCSVRLSDWSELNIGNKDVLVSSELVSC